MEQHTAFIGSIPEHYDRYLGPALFEPYAADLVTRVKVTTGGSVLELACGTGILTRRLRNSLPPKVRLVATDLNQAMIDYAARKFPAAEAIEWRQADASNLPFPDESFDAVVCQFGFMFVPDKQKAFQEAYRVLRPAGRLLFNVWDAIEHNDLACIAHQTIAGFFARDPPRFYEVPFSLHDPQEITSLLATAHFTDLELLLLALPCMSPSALEAAAGLVRGNPVIAAIDERLPGEAPRIIGAVANEIAAKYGDKPVRCRMQAYIGSALRRVKE